MNVRKFLDYSFAAFSGWTVIQVGKFLAEKDLWFVVAVSRPPCFEPRGSTMEDFGLETEAT